MRSTRPVTREPSLRRSLIWTTFLCTTFLLLFAGAAAHAADYFVLGRVYSALPLPTGEEPPPNPLTGVPAEQILGENLIAQIPRNLVNVRVLAASDGSELGSYITRNDGGYLISFTSGPGTVSARLVVEELATSKILFESEAVSLSASPTFNILFLLVSEGLADITGDREFAPLVSLPALYTAIFTRVGKIELQTEDPPSSGIQVRLIDFTTGLATIPATVASDLQIPQYQDAPFGGNLFLFGAFSQDLYDPMLGPNVCYKIEIENLDTAVTSDFTDPLVKTKYTVNFSAGTVDTERVTLGPATIGSESNCYRLTPIAASNNEFWSFPDLVALWRTGTRNGRYKVTLDVKGIPPALFQAFSMFTDVNLRLDNVAPLARILPLDPTDFDTPRIYTPGPVPSTADLATSLLGNFPADYGGTADPTCLILNVESTPTKYVAFRLTATHASGFLRSWAFRFQRNDGNNELLLGKRYDGTSTMVDLSGVRISSAQTSTSGFQDLFLYLDPSHLQPVGPTLGGCAYRFVIGASRRTTDGYHFLRSSSDQDLHYVQK